MNEFQFLETLFHKEHERRSEILNSLNLTLLVLSALVTGMFYLITTFGYGLPVWRTATFVCLILLAAIGLFIALFYLIGAMNNFLRAFEYKGLPSMTMQFEWKEELINYYKNETEVKRAKKRAERDFVIDLKLKLIDSIDSNAAINDLKTKRIYKCKIGLSATLIFLVLAMAPYLHGHFDNLNNQSNEKRLCANLAENSLNLLDESIIDTCQHKAMAKDKQTPPPKPPTNRVIIEGESIKPSPLSTPKQPEKK